MEPAATFALWAGAMIVFGGAAYLYRKRQREAFCAAFQNDPEYELVDEEACRLRSRDGGFRIPLSTTLQPTVEGSGKNQVSLWELTVEGISLGKQTSLTLSLEGLFGALREAVGKKDVQIGDEAFDKRFTVRGSEPDIIKAALRQRDVQKSIEALFDALNLRRDLNLEAGGLLTVHARRQGMSPDDARKALKVVRAFAEALHRAGERGRF